jgi:uncharacterized protein YjiS (DUF1127 family)
MLQCTKRIAAMQGEAFTPVGRLLIFRVVGNKDDDERRRIMNLIRNYRNWRRYRDTVSELSRLSNRELNDLGITRGDISTVARRSI